ncbi:heme utilization cystosolic carrier protein HutX [Dongshaea marina]|uniref:heme utilization cystosolic carrier protein HutX n=1 Tax=Dongshaea marina TaxID=2047966 RepID=UPI0018FF5598|nr:heme utilization cystosolic carrier protein HutX [Dongshaea marina]
MQEVAQKPSLSGAMAQGLMELLSSWGNTTTIVILQGCVFEFKGIFPEGSVGHGYFNLSGGIPGLSGHIRLEAIARIGFQDRPHRGKSSYAFVFEDSDGKAIFKVFLGRDERGEIHSGQLEAFNKIRQRQAL